MSALIASFAKKTKIAIGLCTLSVCVVLFEGFMVRGSGLTWYLFTGLLFPLIALLFLLSIAEDNKLVKKTWKEVEENLLQQGASETEIEKVREYWTHQTGKPNSL